MPRIRARASPVLPRGWCGRTGVKHGEKMYRQFKRLIGRGSWIRTNDLQYPKLPRYQAALYPECPASPVDTRFPKRQQAFQRRQQASQKTVRTGAMALPIALARLLAAEQRVADAVAGAD